MSQLSIACFIVKDNRVGFQLNILAAAFPAEPIKLLAGGAGDLCRPASIFAISSKRQRPEKDKD